MDRIVYRLFLLRHLFFFFVPSLNDERRLFVLQSFAQQRVMRLEFIVVIVQDRLELLFQFGPEAFTNRVSSEICERERCFRLIFPLIDNLIENLEK